MRTFFLPGSPNLEETCYGSELACKNPFSQQRLESSSNMGPDLLRQVSVQVLVFLLLLMAENRELPVLEESLYWPCSLRLKQQVGSKFVLEIFCEHPRHQVSHVDHTRRPSSRIKIDFFPTFNLT